MIYCVEKKRKAKVMKNHLKASFIAVGNLNNSGSTNVREPLPELFGICDGAMQSWDRVFMYKDRLIRVNPHWIRDYMLTAKGFRYTEPDLIGLPDLFLENQHESGFFYEIVSPEKDFHSGMHPVTPSGAYIVEPPYRKAEPGCNYGLVRLELEADIEYLMVEGCYLIWQATGDDKWLEQQLPRLDKGLQYMQTSPIRWSRKYSLAKRAHTLDTWDFTNRLSSSRDRMIRPEDPMGIFHGDNTGLYYAMTLMAKMYRYFGQDFIADRYADQAAGLRERIMKHLWNGKFFRHFLMLDPADYGVDETWQLSLSNSYALNRGILDLDQRRSVIEAYQKCRKKYGGELDDFRNLEPPYPHFYKLKPGDYMDGGIAPFVAGELALGAFESGMEKYGADILHRIGCKFLRDGKISFLYNWEGHDMVGGPRCWCGAEVMYAMTAGLAGIRDEEKLFRKVTISPRFAAAGEDHAYVRLIYPASGAACEYEWRSADQQKKVEFTLESEHEHCRLRLYAPADTHSQQVKCNGEEHPFTIETIGESRYICVEPVQQHDHVEVVFC